MSDRIKFNIKEYDFQGMVLNALRKHDDLKEIRCLGDLHKYIKYFYISKLEKLVYQLFCSKKFLEKYDALCSNIIAENFKGAAKFQKIPSVRIYFPGQKSVNFHTDEWYGHGSDIKNFWLPLVNVYGSASLATFNETKNSEVLTTLGLTEGLTIDLINKICEEEATFLKCDYGEIYMFDAKRLHGAMSNQEKITRVSFDFRIRADSSDTGKKDKSFFVSPGFSRVLDKSVSKRFDASAFGYVSSFLNTNFNYINHLGNYFYNPCM